MPIKEKTKINLSVLILVIMALVVLLNTIKFDDMRLVFKQKEVYLDSLGNGKFLFGFIEVNRYDADSIMSYSSEIVDDYIPSGVGADTMALVIILHYYRLADTVSMNEEYISRLESDYPNIEDLRDKVMIVENGYIYSGMYGFINNVRIPRDTLFYTDVVVPKYGMDPQKIINMETLLQTRRAKRKESRKMTGEIKQ